MSNRMPRASGPYPVKVKPDTWNRLATAVDSIGRENRADAKDGQPATVIIKNNTGSDLTQFGIVTLGEPLFDPGANIDSFKRRVIFNGETPVDGEKIAVAQQPIKAGKLGPAVIDGVTIAIINVNEVNDSFALLENGALESGGSGPAEILWVASGTGTGKWGVIRLSDSTIDFENSQMEVIDIAAVFSNADPNGAEKVLFDQNLRGKMIDIIAVLKTRFVDSVEANGVVTMPYSDFSGEFFPFITLVDGANVSRESGIFPLTDPPSNGSADTIISRSGGFVSMTKEGTLVFQKDFNDPANAELHTVGVHVLLRIGPERMDWDAL